MNAYFTSGNLKRGSLARNYALCLALLAMTCLPLAAQVVNHFVLADVQEPRLHRGLTLVAQAADGSNRRHECLLSHVFGAGPVPEAGECICVDVSVEPLEQHVPPRLFCAPGSFYRLGEAICFCKDLAHPIGFIAYKSLRACGGIRRVCGWHGCPLLSSG